MYLQKILFGSPGTGKSWRIEHHYLNELKIPTNSENCVKTVFHPEYTYGDFMGKLMPITRGKQVQYKFFAGHFLKALSQAFKNILSTSPSSVSEINWEEVNNVALVIDEINRGNSSAIFGTVFQLLDRNYKTDLDKGIYEGWSSYSVNLSELEFLKFIEEIGVRISQVDDDLKYQFPGEGHYVFYDSLKDKFLPIGIDTKTRKVMLPPNFSIIATMNTSDNSIYFMDSAFKRRWDWEFVDITSDGQKEKQVGRKLFDGSNWDEFVDNLNLFIKQNGKRIRKIEDKQIGYYFIKENTITRESIMNKLQFFLWDSIFSNDKKPLEDLIGKGTSLVTFGDFIRNCDLFINAIKTKSFIQE